VLEYDPYFIIMVHAMVVANITDMGEGGHKVFCSQKSIVYMSKQMSPHIIIYIFRMKTDNMLLYP
jgi:hypothetical protein